ncbi:hypothetical protein NW768_011457 [Fusarium equiseti]|uniref:TauD/TfdA-like domain-containing protein n=1 Tax=Fusarium equiseti TaxID=61235 RepID=A0ABQ8QXR1_FUSEQ|nr:hypothetical protein NW768_011457 [Fusarium equiseti]
MDQKTDLGDFPPSINLPGTWDGRQFANEYEYIYHLSALEIQEVKDALCHFKALGLDGDLICRENFPLPTLGPKLDVMRLDIYEGKGFGLIRGLDPKDYSTVDLTMIYLGIQSYIANRFGQQDGKGNVLVHIMSDNSSELASHHHRHSTTEITFHNEEAGDIISWLTRSCAITGGRCIIASGYAVYNALDKESILLLSRQNWIFSSQYACLRPIFFYHKKKLILNFGRIPLIGNATHPRPPNLPPVSKQQYQLLDEIEHAARQLQLEIKTQPGDIHFINNLFILHRRDCFSNGDQPGEKRHLVRMILQDDALHWVLPESLKYEWSRSFDGMATKLWHIDPMPEGFFPLRSYPN